MLIMQSAYSKLPRVYPFTANRALNYTRQTLRLYAQQGVMDKPGGKVSAKKQLLEARKDLEEIITGKHCNPILVRLAWHDSGSYDKVCAPSREDLDACHMMACSRRLGTTGDKEFHGQNAKPLQGDLHLHERQGEYGTRFA